MDADSFCSWLVQEVRDIQDRTQTAAPLLLWCDPHREWLDLLRVASQADSFELRAPPAGSAVEHELLLRNRLHSTARAARVVWLPCAPDEVTWCKPFQSEANVLAKKDLDKAIADRAEWRADERRWCRERKLPRPGWWLDQGEPE